jgi:purine-binding chemotaxis protein CheW
MSRTKNMTPTAAPGKYLTVVLAGEAYGITVLHVREIIRIQKLTPAPQMPAHIKGVINLRGRVVPVVDLRTKFGLPAGIAERTCIVVVQLRPAAGETISLGVIVDSVEEVALIAAEQIEPPPDFGTAVDAHYLQGVAKNKDVVTLLLDLDRVLIRESGGRPAATGGSAAA